MVPNRIVMHIADIRFGCCRSLADYLTLVIMISIMPSCAFFNATISSGTPSAHISLILLQLASHPMPAEHGR